MKKYFIYLFCLIFSTANLFAYDYDKAVSVADRLAAPYIEKKEIELLSDENISKEEKEYILDCYKIDIVMEVMYANAYKEYFGDITSGFMLDDCYERYDKLLNKYYNLYRNLLNEEQKNALLLEQRTWLQLRDIINEDFATATIIINDIKNMGTDSYSSYIVYLRNLISLRLDFLKYRVEELFNYYEEYKNYQKIRVIETGIKEETTNLVENIDSLIEDLRENPFAVKEDLLKLENSRKKLDIIITKYINNYNAHLKAVNYTSDKNTNNAPSEIETTITKTKKSFHVLEFFNDILDILADCIYTYIFLIIAFIVSEVMYKDMKNIRANLLECVKDLSKNVNNNINERFINCILKKETIESNIRIIKYLCVLILALIIFFAYIIFKDEYVIVYVCIAFVPIILFFIWLLLSYILGNKIDKDMTKLEAEWRKYNLYEEFGKTLQQALDELKKYENNDFDDDFEDDEEEMAFERYNGKYYVSVVTYPYTNSEGISRNYYYWFHIDGGAVGMALSISNVEKPIFAHYYHDFFEVSENIYSSIIESEIESETGKLYQKEAILTFSSDGLSCSIKTIVDIDGVIVGEDIKEFVIFSK